ncbi:unnamed protein product [Paramecium sonneborni]|uniref:Transmembrane protein n=1 Tax=Paramecium sonneborni TaxID=65129 RepID=A0A8S1PTZ4_9CILI|nr:unnamed protein product [Paramecium sonneborni]
MIITKSLSLDQIPGKKLIINIYLIQQYLEKCGMFTKAYENYGIIALELLILLIIQDFSLFLFFFQQKMLQNQKKVQLIRQIVRIIKTIIRYNNQWVILQIYYDLLNNSYQ